MILYLQLKTEYSAGIRKPVKTGFACEITFALEKKSFFHHTEIPDVRVSQVTVFKSIFSILKTYFRHTSQLRKRKKNRVTSYANRMCSLLSSVLHISQQMTLSESQHEWAEVILTKMKGLLYIKSYIFMYLLTRTSPFTTLPFCMVQAYNT